MLSQAQRTTILELNAKQVSKREIARVMGISRVAVRKVLRSNSTALPELHRAGAPARAAGHDATRPAAVLRAFSSDNRAADRGTSDE